MYPFRLMPPDKLPIKLNSVRRVTVTTACYDAVTLRHFNRRLLIAVFTLPFAALLSILLIAPNTFSPISSLVAFFMPSPFPTFPLSSPTILSLLEGDMIVDRSIALKAASESAGRRDLPWTGMLPLESPEPFQPEAKYVYFRRGMDHCVGYIHYTASLRCRAQLAHSLNRTLLVDAEFCTADGHTRDGRGFVKPLHAYYDMDVVRVQVPYVPLNHFLYSLHHYLSSSTPPTVPPSLSAVVLPDNHFLTTAATMRLAAPTLVLWNLTEHGAGGLCSIVPDTHEMERQLIWPHPSLKMLTKLIAGSINGSHYAAVHIRRGDKIKEPEKWPHLDNDTQPESLLLTLPRFVPEGSALYIATDEVTPHFFDPLKTKFQVFTIDDFQRFWAPGSQWHTTYADMLGPNPDFDDTMRGIVDYGVFLLARPKVRTFPDLATDPRYGV